MRKNKKYLLEKIKTLLNQIIKKLFYSSIDYDIIIIFFVFLISLFFRLYKFDKYPFGIEGDEFSWSITSYLNIFNIPSYDVGLWSMHQAMADSFPISIFFNKISFIFFGQDLLSPRKFLIILTSLSMVSFYLLNRCFFNYHLSFLNTLLYSLSTYRLAVSKIAIPHSYLDLFLYITFYLMILSVKKYNYIYAFLMSLSLSIILFTYNTSYIVFFIILFFLIFNFHSSKFSKKFFLLIFVFLIPLFYFSKNIISNLYLEYQRKSYALTNLVLNFSESKIDYSKLKENLLIIKRQLFDSLNYETSDMLVYFKATLFPKFINFLALFGLIISLFQFKKYNLIFFWFIISIIIQILFGFYLPRMWIINAGSLFFLYTIFLNFIKEHFFNGKKTKLFFYVCIYLISFIIIFNGLNIYFSDAIKNPAYLNKLKYLNILIKDNKRYLPNNIIFISEKDFNSGVIYPIMAFYSVNNELIKFNIRNNNMVFKVFTIEEFLNYKNYVNNSNTRYKIFIDNNELMKLEINKIISFKKIIKKDPFFSEIIFN